MSDKSSNVSVLCRKISKIFFSFLEGEKCLFQKSEHREDETLSPDSDDTLSVCVGRKGLTGPLLDSVKSGLQSS